jgi:hypothetical protein
MKKNIRLTESELVKVIKKVIKETDLSESMFPATYAMMAAEDAASKVSQMLMSEYPKFAGPDEKGSIKNMFMKMFCERLENIILNKDEEMGQD